MSSHNKKKKPLRSYFGFYIVLFGLVHIFLGSYSVLMKAAPRYFGNGADALLVEKETVQHRRKLIKYYFNYSFTDESGKTITGRNLVTPEFFESVESGKHFELKYLKFIPRANYISGSSSSMMAYTILIMGLFITIGGIVGFTMHLQRERENIEELNN